MKYDKGHNMKPENKTYLIGSVSTVSLVIAVIGLFIAAGGAEPKPKPIELPPIPDSAVVRVYTQDDLDAAVKQAYMTGGMNVAALAKADEKFRSKDIYDQAHEAMELIDINLLATRAIVRNRKSTESAESYLAQRGKN